MSELKYIPQKGLSVMCMNPAYSGSMLERGQTYIISGYVKGQFTSNMFVTIEGYADEHIFDPARFRPTSDLVESPTIPPLVMLNGVKLC